VTKITLSNFEFQMIELALLKLQSVFIVERNDFDAASDVKEIIAKLKKALKGK